MTIQSGDGLSTRRWITLPFVRTPSYPLPRAFPPVVAHPCAGSRMISLRIMLILAVGTCISLASAPQGMTWVGLITVTASQSQPTKTRAFLEETPKGVSARKGIFTAAPHPSYPVDAVRRKREGTGVFEIHFRRDGSASRVAMLRSTGHRVLDKEAVSTFKMWRCHPGMLTQLRIPVRFALQRQ